MAHSQAAKAQTHERILRVAAERLRQTGIDRLGIADDPRKPRQPGGYVIARAMHGRRCRGSLPPNCRQCILTLVAASLGPLTL